MYHLAEIAEVFRQTDDSRARQQTSSTWTIYFYTAFERFI